MPVLITGLVRVLFVSTSVVALPTSVSVDTGKVTVTSPEGFPGDKVNSCASSLEPSNTKLPVIVPPNAIVSAAESPRLIVPPLKVEVPVTVKLPPTPKLPEISAAPLISVSYTHLTLTTILLV